MYDESQYVMERIVPQIKEMGAVEAGRERDWLETALWEAVLFMVRSDGEDSVCPIDGVGLCPEMEGEPFGGCPLGPDGHYARLPLQEIAHCWFRYFREGGLGGRVVRYNDRLGPHHD